MNLLDCGEHRLGILTCRCETCGEPYHCTEQTALVVHGALPIFGPAGEPAAFLARVCSIECADLLLLAKQRQYGADDAWLLDYFTVADGRATIDLPSQQRVKKQIAERRWKR